ncbi:MAG: chorismate--pyruvate lyase [Lachnospiraceae bacterium]
METATYQVIRIDGDYAILRRLDEEDAAEILVARALLPPEIREGSRLLREFLEYSIIDE